METGAGDGSTRVGCLVSVEQKSELVSDFGGCG